MTKHCGPAIAGEREYRASLGLPMIVSCFLSALLGCTTNVTPIEVSYGEATNLNTVAAYQEFLRKNPENPHTNYVLKAIEKRRFEEASMVNSSKAYRDFIRDNNSSSYVAEAEIRVTESDAKRFKRAVHSSTTLALSSFLADFPSSIYVEQARDALEWKTNNGVHAVAIKFYNFDPAASSELKNHVQSHFAGTGLAQVRQ
jgi:outer membrane protein assembly factor BamD (BamD/ComL family)